MPPANVVPAAPIDGVTYASAVALTSSEATLGDATQVPTEIPVVEGQAILATIQLSINGIITSNNMYVVLQMDMGDGVWVDINWLVFTGNQGSTVFTFSNGVAGANTFQQTRQSGAFPASSSSNQTMLAGRLRFRGKAVMTGGSGTVGGNPAITVTIKYKLMNPR